MEEEITKVTELRNNEYYFQQDLFDILYKRSKENWYFYKLIPLIVNDNNIRLSYRNIKCNKGSKTSGLSGKNISFISKMKLMCYLKLVKNRVMNYYPLKIKRIGIPKSNGKIRYLGIKEPLDKIVEQCIYQILEPILTAKFHNNSNGFIKGRSCERTIAQMNNFIIKKKLYYVIDIDIKSFFDNVNHGKLLKQLWSAGIKDKNLLKVISKMLKAEVFNVGIPTKGTPQGGILSPLLANLVLNELDWWLDGKKGLGIHFVRYADDLRILCPSYSIARNMLEKTKDWLNKRLKLEVSEEKTKIINLKRNYTTFLGCKIKVKKTMNKYHIVSSISDKAFEKCRQQTKHRIKEIKRYKNNIKKCNKLIDNYNSYVMGIHNYYDLNTKISDNFSKLNYVEMRYIIKNLSDVLTFDDKVDNNNFIIINYGKNGLPYIRGKPLIPIGKIKYRAPKNKGEKRVNYFTSETRKLIHKELNLKNMFVLEKFLNKSFLNETVELNDNLVSKFCGQHGKYYITNKYIIDIQNVSFVRINRKNDKYGNLLIVENKIKKLVELVEVDDMVEISRLKSGLTNMQLEKINLIRKENSLSSI